jgi:hypothetical protein
VQLPYGTVQAYDAEHPTIADGTVLFDLDYEGGGYFIVTNGFIEALPSCAGAIAVLCSGPTVQLPYATIQNYVANHQPPASPTGASNNPSSTTPTSSAGTSGESGVLGIKEQHPLAARAAQLASTSISASRTGTITLKVSCPDTTGVCTGKVTVRTLTALPAAVQRRKGKATILTLASGDFATPAGRTSSLVLHLSSEARNLLSRTRTLRARITITGREPKGIQQTTVAIHATSRRRAGVARLSRPATIEKTAGIRRCGRVSRQHTTFAVDVFRGRVSCATARYVIEYVLTHGKPTQDEPGTSLPGWQCGYGYVQGNHTEYGRAEPNCSRRQNELQGTQAGYTPAD